MEGRGDLPVASAASAANGSSAMARKGHLAWLLVSHHPLEMVLRQGHGAFMAGTMLCCSRRLILVRRDLTWILLLTDILPSWIQLIQRLNSHWIHWSLTRCLTLLRLYQYVALVATGTKASCYLTLPNPTKSSMTMGLDLTAHSWIG